MTSTSFNVGLTDSRNSSKVLKPPGGGSSDIFGTSGSDYAEPQRKSKQHLTSNIFGGEPVSTPARNKQGNDSFLNLFGKAPPSRPLSAPRDKFRSNIAFEEEHVAKTEAKKSLTFSEDIEVPEVPVISQTEVNDVKITNGETTKAEAPAVNGVASTPSSGSTSPTPTPTAPAAPVAAPKQRVPPGGFSQGLW